VATQVTSRSTKAQIYAAYTQLLSEHKQLEAQHEQLLKEKASLEGQVSKLSARPPARREKPRAAVPAPPREQTMEAILDGLATLRAGFGSAISELSTKLTAEATRLVELRQNAEAKAHQLAMLFDLEIGENTLDDLLQEYRDKSAAFEEASRQERETFEAEMAQKRAAWKEEQEEHARAIKERNDALKKERKREGDEFKYDLQSVRKLGQEQYEREKKARNSALEALAETNEKEWATRENAIAEQEREYQELKSRAEAHPGELESAVRRATREGTDLARREAKVRDDLLSKEEEGDRRVAELKIQSLEEVIQGQAQQIEGLSAQLGAIVRQDQDLAIKAIEGASHETSFQSIREIALQQAKRPPKGD
jgi:hypothetical protein